MPNLTKSILKDGLDIEHERRTREYVHGEYIQSFESAGEKRVLLRPGDVQPYNVTAIGENDDAEWWVYTRANDGFEDNDRLIYADGFHGATEWHLIEPQHSIDDNLVLWKAQEDDR